MRLKICPERLLLIQVCFLPKERKNIKCRINKKAQIIQNSSEMMFRKVHKVSPDSTDHKIVQFLKGVWDKIYLRGRWDGQRTLCLRLHLWPLGVQRVDCAAHCWVSTGVLRVGYKQTRDLRKTRVFSFAVFCPSVNHSRNPDADHEIPRSPHGAAEGNQIYESKRWRAVVFGVDSGCVESWLHQAPRPVRQTRTRRRD